MSKVYLRSTEELLRGYSVLVEYWSDDAGDTHELLGERELLAERELTDSQIEELGRVDEQVLALVESITTETWDTLMLKKTAELIQHGQGQLRKTA